MTQALASEWSKLRTTRAAPWMLALVVALSVGIGALVANAQTSSVGLDATKTALIGLDFGQAVVAGLAMLLIGPEYATGMISVTLTATPQRLRVLAAKAALLLGVTLPVAVLSVVASLLVGVDLLSRLGLDPAHGYLAVSLGNAATLRAAIGAVLYLCLIALLSLGVATIIKEPAGAIGALLGLLFLFPILSAIVPDHDLARHLQQVGPMSAGLLVEATQGLSGLPLTPWQGLGVLAAWAVGSIVLAALIFHRRDA